MKKCVLLLMMLLLLTACTRGEEGPEGGYQLYFVPDQSVSYGSALAAQPWKGETPDARGLMEGLLAGPTREGLSSPFPKGLTLQALEVEEGSALVRLTLSEQYSGLTDIAQTLADACIVRTLCQLPQVEGVEISTDGFWASRPASRTLTLEQLELDSLLPG